MDVHHRKNYKSETSNAIIADDHINNLPDDLLHHIVSLLSIREAISTSVLSKRWRYVWRPIHILDFNQDHFNNPSQFIYFVDQTLLHHSFLNMQSFRIKMDYYEDGDLPSQLDSWIDCVMMHQVRVLNLLFTPPINIRPSRYKPYEKCYQVPCSVFDAQSITSIQLTFCKFVDFGIVSMVSLKTLSLTYVLVTDETMRLVVTNCPSLEFLHLTGCHELVSLEGRNKSIKTLAIVFCRNLKKFEMDVPSLQSFEFKSNPKLEIMSWGENELTSLQFQSPGLSNPFNNSEPDFKNIKVLSLTNVNIVDVKFKSLMSKCLHLEKLELVGCLMLPHLEVSSEKLKSLVLDECSGLKEAEINTPNLKYFEFQGSTLELSIMNTSCMLEAKLHFKGNLGDWNDLQRYDELRRLLERFDHVKVLTLCSYFAEAMLLPVELLKNSLPPLYNLKHLRMTASDKSMTYKEILECLLSLSAHLEILTLDLFPLNINLKFQFQATIVDYSKFVLAHLPRDYVQHRLKEVTIENIVGHEDEMELVKFILGDATDLATVSIPPSRCLTWKA